MLAFFKLIRLPNLLIIALTQYLIRYAVLLPFFDVYQLKPGLSHFDFFLLVLSTVLIAAAGYAINDYFDIPTDRINKPDRVVVDKKIKRRVAMALHLLFNVLAIGLGFYIGYKVGLYKLGLVHVFSAGLLWFYSTDFKKQFLAGNVIVALLTGCVPLVVPVFEVPMAKTELREVQAERDKAEQEFMNLVTSTGQVISEQQAMQIHQAQRNVKQYDEYIENADNGLGFVFKVIALFGVFAFLVSLIREIVKDMEDYEGDKATGCRTMPIVLSIASTKYIVTMIVLATILGLGYIQFVIYIDQAKYPYTYLLIGYLIVLVQLPLALLMLQLYKSSSRVAFRRVSLLIKLVMLFGVLYSAVIYYSLTSAMAG
jgi:4-hydroxybenzoate polyprenyltransferase